MRVKRHLIAAGIGAGIVWFTHPQDGERRRREARDALYRLERTVRRTMDSTIGTVSDADPLPPNPATLLEVVEAAKQRGLRAEFTVAADALVHCSACGHDASPDTLSREWMHRLEGTSDPDELLTVSAVTCPACGAKGLLVLPFGPAADAREGDVARRLPDPVHADMAPLAV
jgi:hypothetical protein